MLEDLFCQARYDMVVLAPVFPGEVVQRWWAGLPLGKEAVVVLLASLRRGRLLRHADRVGGVVVDVVPPSVPKRVAPRGRPAGGEVRRSGNT